MNIETSEPNNAIQLTNPNNNNSANEDIKPMDIEEEGKISENNALSIKKQTEILENIAEEAEFSKENILGQTLNKIGNNETKEEIKIKTGWVNFEAKIPHLDIEETNHYMQHIIESNPMKRDKLANKIILRNYEYPFNIIDFEDMEGLKFKQVVILKEVLKNVFVIIFKDKFLNVFDICNLIHNDFFSYTSIKIDDNKAFIEIAFDEENENEQRLVLDDVLKTIVSNERILEVYNYEEFHKKNFLNILFDQ